MCVFKGRFRYGKDESTSNIFLVDCDMSPTVLSRRSTAEGTKLTPYNSPNLPSGGTVRKRSVVNIMTYFREDKLLRSASQDISIGSGTPGSKYTLSGSLKPQGTVAEQTLWFNNITPITPHAKTYIIKNTPYSEVHNIAQPRPPEGTVSLH